MLWLACCCRLVLLALFVLLYGRFELHASLSHHLGLLSKELREGVVEATDEQIDLGLCLAYGSGGREERQGRVVVAVAAVVDELAALGRGY